MRIVHVASGDLWAGAEVATYHLLVELTRRVGIQIRTVLLNEGEFARRLRAAEIPVTVLSEREFSFVRLARHLRRILDDADLVHSHRYKEDILAALSGKPWVATRHGRPEPFEGLARIRMGLFERLDSIAQRHLARCIVAPSRCVAEWMSHRVGPERIVIIPNGMPDPTHSVSIYPWHERPFVVGMAARLAPVKNIELAIDALAECDGVSLEIVGDGPLRHQLRLRADARNVGDRVRFLGFEPDPLPRMGRWRALLVTSLAEASPMAVIEALSMGTPVITSHLPSVADMLDDKSGRVVNSADPTVWAEVIAKFVRDAGPGESASIAARKRFEDRFHIQRVAERTYSMYCRVLGCQPQ